MATQAFILAAGKGTRLRPLTDRTPKSMLPIGNVPALEHIVRWLRGHGIRELAVNLHHHGEAIVGHFGDGTAWGVSITYSYEPELLGSAGALRACRGACDRPLVVVYGDVLTDLDLSALIGAHRSHARPGTPHVTLSLQHVARPEEKGIVALDATQRVTRFTEKPRPGEAYSDLANAGVLVAEPELIATIPDDCVYDIGHDWLPQLLGAGVPVYGWPLPPETYLVDFGTRATYRQVQHDWPRRVAVFLDRDGVVNENCPGYTRTWEQVRFLPGSLEALRELAATTMRIVMVSNQSAINRGLMSEAQVRDINRRMVEVIEAAGGRVDAVYFCPHRPDESCECRKPRPGMLQRAAAELGLSLRRSYLIGDNLSDIGAALAVGAQPILVRTGLGQGHVDKLEGVAGERCVIQDDLAAAARWILETEAAGGGARVGHGAGDHGA